MTDKFTPEERKQLIKYGLSTIFALLLGLAIHYAGKRL